MTNEILKDVYVMTLDPIFNENAICFSNKLGFEIVKDFKPKPKELYVVFGAHLKSPELLQIQKELNFTFGYIIMPTANENSSHCFGDSRCNSQVHVRAWKTQGEPLHFVDRVVEPLLHRERAC